MSTTLKNLQKGSFCYIIRKMQKGVILTMAISKEKQEGFDKVIHEVLHPVTEECGDELNKLVKEDSEINSQVDTKLQQILNKRNRKT